MVIFDWFGVLSRSWDTRLRRFSNRFLLAFNRFLFELRPIEVGICSYADTNRERYLRDCLRPAREQIVNLQASPADFWLLQTTQRTGPEGKASFLHQVSTNYFVDDNPLICRECRRTGCVVVRADPSLENKGCWTTSTISSRTWKPATVTTCPLQDSSRTQSSSLTPAPRSQGGSARV